MVRTKSSAANHAAFANADSSSVDAFPDSCGDGGDSVCFSGADYFDAARPNAAS